MKPFLTLMHSIVIVTLFSAPITQWPKPTSGRKELISPYSLQFSINRSQGGNSNLQPEAERMDEWHFTDLSWLLMLVSYTAQNHLFTMGWNLSYSLANKNMLPQTCLQANLMKTIFQLRVRDMSGCVPSWQMHHSPAPALIYSFGF